MNTKSISLQLLCAALCATSIVPTINTSAVEGVINWVKDHKALTTLFSLALLYPHINNYLLEAGKEELKNEKTGAIKATPVTMKEKILYYIKKMIGYKIQTKNGEAKIKVLNWNNNMDLVLKGEVEIHKTELKSVKLGRLFEIIETTIEKNQALLIAGFLATIIKNCDDIAKVFPSVVKPI